MTVFPILQTERFPLRPPTLGNFAAYAAFSRLHARNTWAVHNARRLGHVVPRRCVLDDVRPRRLAD